MSKIFRLYKEGASTYRGWNESPVFPYNSTARETIDDPDGASAKNEITSIPSPFARIDLVKTAFREVCRRANGNLKELDGNTIYHKMVSDTLDVGEIFFNIDKLTGKVEIISCDCAAVIQQLREDGNPNHFLVADSLEKFLQSDAKTYNFNQLHNIYLLNYAEGPDELNIIGATSPSTLFFSGANKLDYVNDIFFSNNDKPFDKDYQPLYKRDFEYLKSWWVLRKTTPNFSSLFPEIDTYLNLTYRALTDQNQKNQLTAISAQALDDFSVIDVKSNNQLNQVEVLGINLLKKKQTQVGAACEFTILPSQEVKDKRPLVLPVEAGNKYASLNYVNGAWGKTYKAPYVDDVTVENRCLPFDGSKHPYLTLSDFLEDTLIRVPHTLNAKSYFDGNIGGNRENCSYLLPIKPLYFKYFDVETLMSKLPDGKAALEMSVVAGGSVSLTLRVPIVGNGKVSYIEYQRLYYNDRKPSVKADCNEGGISELDFTGLVMPGVKFQQTSEAYYTVACVTPFSVQAKMQFFAKGTMLRDVPMDCRNQQKGVFDFKAETYTLAQKNFDFLRIVSRGEQAGILIPLFPTYQGLDTYEFAVDLGTSNTHIEMKKQGIGQSVPFTCNESDGMVSKFFVPSYSETPDGNRIKMDLRDEDDLIDADFMPSMIGKNSDFFFPTRTALSCAKTIDWNGSQRVFGLLNFSLTYNKRRAKEYNADPMVNIKWSNEPNAQTAMQLYIENLLLLIRNKVVVMNGNIQQTKITWFYPSSMSAHRLSQFRNAWNQTYNKLFSSQSSTIEKSESEAPIKYYFNRYASATNLVNIDIGGGTTDVAFSEGGVVNYITSFRFAGNSLFEDTFSQINPNNGIIDFFKNEMLELLQTNVNSNAQSDLINLFHSNEGHPADMASFLFSLKDNSATKDIASQKIDFNAVLQNDDKFKIVFILFYTAIVYHVAQIVKAKGLNTPRHIAFSGNGSKIVNVLTSDNRILSAYTKAVFEQVLERPYGKELEILGLDKNSNPKEATCKGGLLPSTASKMFEKVDLKTATGELITPQDTYASLDDKAKKEIVRSVKQFFHFTLHTMPSVFSFEDNFGVSVHSIELARNECSKDLETYLEKGINISLTDSGNADNKIDEALSFYPIKGAIQALSTEIEKQYRNY